MLTFLQLQEKRSSCVQPLRMATWSFTHSAGTLVAMVLDDGHYITITQPDLPILYKFHFHLKVKDESLLGNLDIPPHKPKLPRG